MRLGSAKSVGLIGLKAFVIHAQAFISPGLPFFSIIGLPDASLSESRERVRSACSAAGFRWPQTRVTVNLSPASKPKHGSSHDLAIAASVLGAGGTVPLDGFDDAVTLGELNLDGTVLPVNGLLPILTHAAAHGIRRAFVPLHNLAEAKLVGGLEVTGIRHLGQLVEAMGGRAVYHLPEQGGFGPDLEADEAAGPDMTHEGQGDMSEVVGQEEAKHAMTVAAAGGHHMIMVGPPGAGKTMLASRLPGILPPLDEKERLEVASIRSLCGTLKAYGVSDLPPFVAPHHTASTASMVGGGSGLAMPGAITRAHCGVLFMDEATEFSPRVLQTLREPLETHRILLSRSRGSAIYPARFQLVMAANPCPCGFGYGTGERCTCTSRERRRYWARLSGPILDRIDIQTTVPPVSNLPTSGLRRQASSATIKAQVVKARQVARSRYRREGWTCNAQASGEWLRVNTSRKTSDQVNRALESQLLSLRGADRAMRLAWTLADLDGRDSPNRDDIEAGILLRTRLS